MDFNPNNKSKTHSKIHISISEDEFKAKPHGRWISKDESERERDGQWRGNIQNIDEGEGGKTRFHKMVASCMIVNGRQNR